MFKILKKISLLLATFVMSIFAILAPLNHTSDSQINGYFINEIVKQNNFSHALQEKIDELPDTIDKTIFNTWSVNADHERLIVDDSNIENWKTEVFPNITNTDLNSTIKAFVFSDITNQATQSIELWKIGKAGTGDHGLDDAMFINTSLAPFKLHSDIGMHNAYFENTWDFEEFFSEIRLISDNRSHWASSPMLNPTFKNITKPFNLAMKHRLYEGGTDSSLEEYLVPKFRNVVFEDMDMSLITYPEYDSVKMPYQVDFLEWATFKNVSNVDLKNFTADFGKFENVNVIKNNGASLKTASFKNIDLATFQNPEKIELLSYATFDNVKNLNDFYKNYYLINKSDGRIKYNTLLNLQDGEDTLDFTSYIQDNHYIDHISFKNMSMKNVIWKDGSYSSSFMTFDNLTNLDLRNKDISDAKFINQDMNEITFDSTTTFANPIDANDITFDNVKNLNLNLFAYTRNTVFENMDLKSIDGHALNYKSENVISNEDWKDKYAWEITDNEVETWFRNYTILDLNNKTIENTITEDGNRSVIVLPNDFMDNIGDLANTTTKSNLTSDDFKYLSIPMGAIISHINKYIDDISIDYSNSKFIEVISDSITNSNNEELFSGKQITLNKKHDLLIWTFMKLNQDEMKPSANEFAKFATDWTDVIKGSKSNELLTLIQNWVNNSTDEFEIWNSGYGSDDVIEIYGLSKIENLPIMKKDDTTTNVTESVKNTIINLIRGGLHDIIWKTDSSYRNQNGYIGIIDYIYNNASSSESRPYKYLINSFQSGSIGLKVIIDSFDENTFASFDKTKSPISYNSDFILSYLNTNYSHFSNIQKTAGIYLTSQEIITKMDLINGTTEITIPKYTDHIIQLTGFANIVNDLKIEYENIVAKNDPSWSITFDSISQTDLSDAISGIKLPPSDDSIYVNLYIKSAASLILKSLLNNKIDVIYNSAQMGAEYKTNISIDVLKEYINSNIVQNHFRTSDSEMYTTEQIIEWLKNAITAIRTQNFLAFKTKYVTNLGFDFYGSNNERYIEFLDNDINDFKIIYQNYLYDHLEKEEIVKTRYDSIYKPTSNEYNWENTADFYITKVSEAITQSVFDGSENINNTKHVEQTIDNIIFNYKNDVSIVVDQKAYLLWLWLSVGLISFIVLQSGFFIYLRQKLKQKLLNPNFKNNKKKN